MSTTTREMTTATFRIERDMKEKAQKIYKSLGLDFSTAMNIFIYRTIHDNGIPFELRNETIPNKKTQKIIAKSLKDENTVGPFYSVEELMEDLNASDPHSGLSEK